MSVDPRARLADVDLDDPVLLRAEEIEIADAGHLEPPVDRFERGVAVEEVEGVGETLVAELLAPAPEELEAPGPLGGDVLRHRQAAHVESALAREREVEKG